LRMRVERTFAWEDKFKRLLLRFERIQQRHYGMKLLAYTLINLCKFCGTSNLQPVNRKEASLDQHFGCLETSEGLDAKATLLICTRVSCSCLRLLYTISVLTSCGSDKFVLDT
jgi:hypothetical protein